MTDSVIELHKMNEQLTGDIIYSRPKRACASYLRWYLFTFLISCRNVYHLDRVKRIWYLSPMRAAKVQASLRIRAVSPEPPLLAHTSSESRGTFRQKARSLAPLNGWACAVKICHDGMLEDANLLDGAHFYQLVWNLRCSISVEEKHVAANSCRSMYKIFTDTHIMRNMSQTSLKLYSDRLPAGFPSLCHFKDL